MRILYHHRTQAEDGQAVHIRSLVEAFRQEGHDVREVALVARSNGTAGDAGKSRWGWIGSAPTFVRELAEYGYTLPARRRLVREVRTERPDFLYERYAFGNAAGVQAAEKLGLPIVLEVNAPMAHELQKTRGLAFARLARRVEASIFQRATRVCVVTGVLRDILVEMGVEPEKLLVTPNGVHLELFEHADRDAARADLGLSSVSGPVLGFVGYYRDWHRLDLVVAALTQRALREVHLVLVGAGPAEAGLRESATQLGVLDRVHFAGTRAHERVPALLPAFDVALVPAINPYASPLKLHEYMAASRAILAPDQPNLREVLQDDVNALLVPAGDEAALNDALGRLVADAVLRERLGTAARRTIDDHDLTWRGNARRVIAAVKEIR